MSNPTPSPAQRITVPLPSTAPLPPRLRSAINAALVAHNVIPGIQAALLHECQVSGFVAALRARALELLRAGECAGYAEVMATVVGEVRASNERALTTGKVGVNGAVGRAQKGKDEGEDEDEDEEEEDGEDEAGFGSGSGAGLQVPERVVREGIRVVKGALEGVVDIGPDEV